VEVGEISYLCTKLQILMSKSHFLITVVGPTASGKTQFAAHLALALNGEIISGDSRQIYKGMDIGTGKDLREYCINNHQIPYHLIDIRPAGDKYTLFDYQKDFQQVYQNIISKNKFPILCGGTGLYIESVLKGYNLPDVPQDNELRRELSDKSLSELTQILSVYKNLHNKTDVDTPKRAIRAIEIARYISNHHLEKSVYAPIPSLIIGLNIDRELRREKITKRLHERINEGMIEEVQRLLDSGIPAEDLIYYGLEYKFLTLYLTRKLSKKEMISQLEIAIHQFAKRQMTWFRGMEKRGLHIHWIDATLEIDLKIKQALSLAENFKKELE